MTVGAGPDPDRAELDELGWQLHLATKALDGRPFTAPEVFVSSLRDVATAAEPLLTKVQSLLAELAEVSAQANSWQRHAQDADTALTAALDQLGVERARREAVEAKVRAVETLRTWTNEDGRRFVFADDLAVALGIVAANKRCPHAAWHGNDCTASNAPNQPGSDAQFLPVASLPPEEDRP